MSRVGKKPIVVPKGVTVTIEGDLVTAKGPLGEMSFRTRPEVAVKMEDGHVLVENVAGGRGSALHGTSRSQINNIVQGCSTGFSRGLEIVGTGYRAALAGRTLEINIGFNAPVKVPLPDGLTAEVTDKPPKIMIKGMNKDAVGQLAANIRGIRPPEPYLGKGIRYEGEQVRRKAGKSAG
ncbi:MAG: 50S ribosomal protein L6 [Candidatus Eisenbacteria bacterium]|nr:50S ribosomal protein L6 [Candidatus Eisenbacteria bacterium]MCC7141928.1 50S ribosomal protein L6 [Candidatus Eisenbacteria bacterium]